MASNWDVMQRAAKAEGIAVARKELQLRKKYPDLQTADIALTAMEKAARYMDAAKWEMFESIQDYVREHAEDP